MKLAHLFFGNYIRDDTAIQNNKNYLLKNNLNNLRGNQLPAALKEYHVSVNWDINPIFYNDNTDNLRGNQKHPKKSRTFSGTPHSLPRSRNLM